MSKMQHRTFKFKLYKTFKLKHFRLKF